MPSIENRRMIVEECHKDLLHRGIEAVYYELKRKYYGPGIKETIKRMIKECETCQMVNRKRKGVFEYVTTTRPFEKVGLDLIDLRENTMYVLIAIDYYTQYLNATILKCKEAKEIVGAIKTWMEIKRYQKNKIENRKEFIIANLKRCVGIWE